MHIKVTERLDDCVLADTMQGSVCVANNALDL